MDYVRITAIEDSPEYSRDNLHQHDDYELVWFNEVDAPDVIDIDFGEYPVESDTFYFISARQMHRLDRRGKRGIVISIAPDFFNQIVETNVYPRSAFAINSIINMRKCDLCRSMVFLITKEYYGQCRYSLMESYFRALFIHLGPILDKNPTVGLKRKAADLLDLVEENYVERRDIGFYAERMRMSEKALGDVAKRVLGRTVKDVIAQSLVLEVKRGIAADKESLKELSFRLGFNEPSYFTRFFLRQTGLTPHEFREKFRRQLGE